MISDVLVVVGEAFRWTLVECIAVQTVDVLGFEFFYPFSCMPLPMEASLLGTPLPRTGLGEGVSGGHLYKYTSRKMERKDTSTDVFTHQVCALSMNCKGRCSHPLRLAEFPMQASTPSRFPSLCRAVSNFQLQDVPKFPLQQVR